jgi:hypothetical protein
MTMSRTFFSFPWVTRRTFHDLLWFPFLHTGTVSSLRIIVLYYTVSWSGGCVPRICLNSCDLARVESTERRALILGSPRFCKQKPRKSPPQFLNTRNCDGTPNQPNHESINKGIHLPFQREAPHTKAKERRETLFLTSRLFSL